MHTPADSISGLGLPESASWIAPHAPHTPPLPLQWLFQLLGLCCHTVDKRKIQHERLRYFCHPFTQEQVLLTVPQIQLKARNRPVKSFRDEVKWSHYKFRTMVLLLTESLCLTTRVMSAIPNVVTWSGAAAVEKQIGAFGSHCIEETDFLLSLLLFFFPSLIFFFHCFPFLPLKCFWVPTTWLCIMLNLINAKSNSPMSPNLYKDAPVIKKGT